MSGTAGMGSSVINGGSLGGISVDGPIVHQGVASKDYNSMQQ